MSILTESAEYFDDGLSIAEVLEIEESWKENTLKKYYSSWKKSKESVQEIKPEIQDKIKEASPDITEGLVNLEANIKGEQDTSSLIETHNTLIETQNKLLETQNKLIEANLGVPAGSTSNPAVALSEDQLKFLNVGIEFNKRIDQEREQLPAIKVQMDALEKELGFDYEEDHDYTNLQQEYERISQLRKIGE